MYVHPFICGVVATILVEVVIAVIVEAANDKKGGK